MTTSEKIKQMKGLNGSFIIEKLKGSKYAFYNKIAGKSEWKESEIKEIDRLYKIYQNF